MESSPSSADLSSAISSDTSTPSFVPAMADQTEFRFPNTPGMPLFALSPERVNQQARTGLLQSPSLPNMPGSHGLDDSHFLADSKFSQQNDDAAFQRSGSPSRRENGSPWDKSEASGFSPPKHWRTNSDVQGIVARFNGLEIKDRLDEKLKKSEASLRRAQMGREEAEAQVKEVREEARGLKKELDESKDRERRVAKRLDVVMEDLHRSKETQAHAQTLYEKEIRKVRKEAFRSSSTLVKLQEELKAARATLKIFHSELDLERVKVNKREQETFNAQYQLVGLQEELTRAQTHIRIVEEERDALKTTLKEEEVARVAAEGRIALPPTMADDDEFSSPKKHKQKPLLRSQSPEKEPPRIVLELEQLRAELEEYRLMKEQAEAQVDHMRLECQFGCCSCRVAERQNKSYAHDLTFEEQIRQYKLHTRSMPTPPESMILDGQKDNELEDINQHDLRSLTPPVDINNDANDANKVVYSPNSGTFRNLLNEVAVAAEEDTCPSADNDPSVEQIHLATVPITSEVEHEVYIKQEPEVIDVYNRRKSFALVARIKRAASQLTHHESSAVPDTQLQMFKEESDQLEGETNDLDTVIGEAVFGADEEVPNTPQNNSTWRTSTTTTKVPLVDPATPNPKFSAFGSPGITREEAIQQLRERRGRARSEARTPKKTVDGSMTPRRDISAPEVRAKATPESSTRGRLAHR